MAVAGSKSVRGKPSGICIDHYGRVLVADTHNHRIIVFTSTGEELLRFGERGVGPGQFMLPTDVAVSPNGSIFVSEYGGNDRISVFDRTGEYRFSFGGVDDGTASLQRPSGLAFDGNGDVWVADTSNHRVCRFDSTGRLRQRIGTWGRGPNQFRYPRDVACLGSGRIAVADYENNRIVIIDGDGGFLGTWGTSGRQAGCLHLPANVTSHGNRFIVADTKNHRIQFVEWRPHIAALADTFSGDRAVSTVLGGRYACLHTSVCVSLGDRSRPASPRCWPPWRR